MAWKRVMIPIAALGLLHATAVIAQGPPPGLTMPNARFLNAPQVGEQFPDVTIVDAQGNPA